MPLWCRRGKPGLARDLLLIWMVDALVLSLWGLWNLPFWLGEPPHRVYSLDYWYLRLRGEHLMTSEGVLWRGNPMLHEIALTFDDGPDPLTTPIVLDALRKAKVKATFFLVGKKIKQHPEIVRRILAEGHAVGCHSYDHERQTLLTETQVARQIYDSAVVLSWVGGKFVAYRPPWCDYNEQVLRAVQRWRLPLVMYSVASDPKPYTPVEHWVHWVARRTHNGTILLMHDTYPPTVHALPELLRVLKAKGFRFVTIPEMIDHLQQRQAPSPVKLATSPAESAPLQSRWSSAGSPSAGSSR